MSPKSKKSAKSPTPAASAGDLLGDLLGLLKSAEPELQCAAVLVLGRIRPNDAAIRGAFEEALASAPVQVQVYIADALGRTGDPGVARHLVPLLKTPSPARVKAVQVLIALGPGVVAHLQTKLDAKDPMIKKGILEVLGQFRAEVPAAVLFDSLRDSNLEVAKQSTFALRDRIAAMTPKERAAFYPLVARFLVEPDVKKSEVQTVSGIKLLGYLRDAKAAALLLPCLDPKRPPVVRSHALTSLGHLEYGGKAPKGLALQVTEMLGDPDFENIVQRALTALDRIPVDDALVPELERRLMGAHPAVRQASARTLGRIGSPAAAQALLRAVGANDAAVREAAESALRTNAAFVPGLVKEADTFKDLARGWAIAGILKSHRSAVPPAASKNFLAKCLKAVDKKDSAFQVWFEILRATDPAKLRDALHREGRKRLDRKKPEDAERFLRLLERDDLATPATDFDLAVARLATGSTDLNAPRRDQMPALRLLGRLARHEAFDVEKSFRGAKALGPEHLQFAGFHFLELPEPDHAFGKKILQTLVKRHPKSEAAKAARKKLATQG